MNHLSLDSSELAQSFIRKLLYFDIFSHPLTDGEIFEYCDVPVSDINYGEKILNQLLIHKLVSCENGFYFLGEDQSKVSKRVEANNLASLRMKDAHKYSAIIAAFPFVRGVFISGSLSKQVMKPDSDIDFFIITEPNKLWFCRSLLTLYKKLVLRNSHHNFCLNYFIDSSNLEIPDKNIFTATEIAFLLPMYNYPLYLEFMKSNTWIRSEFPNFKIRPCVADIKTKTSKSIWEKLFDNKMGNYMDAISYSTIVSFWKRKFKYMGEKNFTLNMRSRKNVSKHHPNAFQEKVVYKYAEKMESFERSYDFPLMATIKVNSVQ